MVIWDVESGRFESKKGQFDKKIHTPLRAGCCVVGKHGADIYRNTNFSFVFFFENSETYKGGLWVLHSSNAN